MRVLHSSESLLEGLQPVNSLEIGRSFLLDLFYPFGAYNMENIAHPLNYGLFTETVRREILFIMGMRVQGPMYYLQLTFTIEKQKNLHTPGPSGLPEVLPGFSAVET